MLHLSGIIKNDTDDVMFILIQFLYIFNVITALTYYYDARSGKSR